MSDRIQNHFWIDFCPRLSKMVLKIILHKQITEQLPFEVDVKYGKKNQLSKTVKKIKSGIFFENFNNNKNMLLTGIHFRTEACFFLLQFLKKKGHFWFFWRLLFFMTNPNFHIWRSISVIFELKHYKCYTYLET